MRLCDLNEPTMKFMLDKMGKSIENVAAQHQVDKPKFALLLFDDPGLGQYCCNCERKDVITALRETADRLERKEDIPR